MMNRELLRMALSPYIPANCSGHNQPSAGLCLQLENFPSVLPTSVISAKNEWILFIICPKMCYVGAGFFSIGVCYRDLFSKTLLVEVLPPWSSLWSSFLLCDIGWGLFSLLIVAAVSGCELMITSVSVIRVCSQIPPMWLAAGGFLFQCIQSRPWARRKGSLRAWSVSLKALNITLSPLQPNLISYLIFHCLAMSLLSAWMNNFVSRLLVTSMCMALLARHVNMYP